MNAHATSCIAQDHHNLRGVLSAVRADIDRHLTRSPEVVAYGRGPWRRLSALLMPEIGCLVLHRLSHCLATRGWRRSAGAIANVNLMLHKANISPDSCIGAGCRVAHPPGVVFHGTAGTGLTLYSLAVCCPREDRLDGPAADGPSLGRNVTVGAHAVLLGQVVVGDDAKIAYSVILERNAPARARVVSRSLRLTFVPAAPAVARESTDQRQGRPWTP